MKISQNRCKINDIWWKTSQNQWKLRQFNELMEHHQVPRSDYAFMHDLIVVWMTNMPKFAEIWSESAVFNTFCPFSTKKRSIQKTVHFTCKLDLFFFVEKREMERRRSVNDRNMHIIKEKLNIIYSPFPFF